MNSAEMKAAIQTDIETLKTMDVDILSEKEYYGRIRKRYCLVWMTMYAALILPFLLSYSLNINGIRYSGSEAFEGAILAWLAGIPITFIFTIPLVGLINNYVIFQAQFKDALHVLHAFPIGVSSFSRRRPFIHSRFFSSVRLEAASSCVASVASSTWKLSVLG